MRHQKSRAQYRVIPVENDAWLVRGQLFTRPQPYFLLSKCCHKLTPDLLIAARKWSFLFISLLIADCGSEHLWVLRVATLGIAVAASDILKNLVWIVRSLKASLSWLGLLANLQSIINPTRYLIRFEVYIGYLVIAARAIVNVNLLELGGLPIDFREEV